MDTLSLQNLDIDSRTTTATQFAAQMLRKLGLPTKKSEAYRYFDIEKVLQRKRDLLITKEHPVIPSDTVKIVDGTVIGAPKNLDIQTLQERSYSLDHFDPLYYASHLLSKRIIMIECKENISLKIEHDFTRPDTLYAYRLVIKTKENVHVKIEESFGNCNASGSLVLYGHDLTVASNAHVEMIKNETLVQNGYVPLHSHAITLEAQATASLLTFDFGEGDGLRLFEAVVGENARFDAKHLLYAKKNAKRGNVSQIIHRGKNAQSTQNAKSILQEHARGIFDALIKIENGAAGAKAHQNSKAILLNDGAYMASKPQLEIYIDDVEASHGSTIGELDETQLFYLRSRGIALEEARKMLILAFANEMIDAVSDETTKERVHRAFEEIYYGHALLECISTCHGCSDAILKEEQ